MRHRVAIFGRAEYETEIAPSRHRSACNGGRAHPLCQRSVRPGVYFTVLEHCFTMSTWFDYSGASNAERSRALVYPDCCSRGCGLGGLPGGAAVFPLVVGQLFDVGAVGVHDKYLAVGLGV